MYVQIQASNKLPTSMKYLVGCYGKVVKHLGFGIKEKLWVEMPGVDGICNSPDGGYKFYPSEVKPVRITEYLMGIALQKVFWTPKRLQTWLRTQIEKEEHT